MKPYRKRKEAAANAGMRSRIDSFIMLFLIDVISFYASLCLAYYLRKTIGFILPGVVPLKIGISYYLMLWWMPLVFLFFIAYERLYFKKLVFWYETKILVKSLTIAFLFVLAIVVMGKAYREQTSRVVLILMWMASIFIFPCMRFVSKSLFKRFNFAVENIIVIGAENDGQIIADLMEKNHYLNCSVKGFLDDDQRIWGKEIKIGERKYTVFGGIKHYRRIIRKLGVSMAIVAIPSLSRKKMLEINNALQHHVRKIIFAGKLRGIEILNAEIYQFFMEPILMFEIRNNLRIPRNIVFKRLLDIALSIALLPGVTLIMIVTAIFIKKESPGPVFYTQKRVGYKGRTIMLYKLRSMYSDAEERLRTILKSDKSAREQWEKFYKIKNDPRVTKIGKFIRRWSIDELPQIFNVLKGDMSFVGPRPVVKSEIKKYYGSESAYDMMVKPGITGLWQVSGRTDTTYRFRVKKDMWYALNWSLWLDVALIFKTYSAVFSKKGAY